MKGWKFRVCAQEFVRVVAYNKNEVDEAQKV